MKIDHITNVETSLMDWGEVVAYVEGDAPAVGEGYPAIRIPGIVVLDDGTLLTYNECRQGDDWSAIDIGLRRSTDGGRTWEECLRIAEKAGYSDLCYFDGALYVIFESEEERYIHCARIVL